VSLVLTSLNLQSQYNNRTKAHPSKPYIAGRVNQNSESILTSNHTSALTHICKYVYPRNNPSNKSLTTVVIVTAVALEKESLAKRMPNVGEMVAKADAENAKVAKKDRMKEGKVVEYIGHVRLPHQPCYWNWNELGDLEENPQWREIFLRNTARKG
jgi:hypothetical protein